MGKWLRRSWLRTSSRSLLGLGLSAIGVGGAGLLASCRRVVSSRSKEHPGSASSQAQAEEVMSTSDERKLRQVEQVYRPGHEHWVGDGFWVRTVFSPFQIEAEKISPFLLLDHAAPREFDPTLTPRGVGEHPHRGFETVTFAYQGEVDHRDSAGGGGRIYPGDVQWMTAASGVVHEEKHSREFSENGGIFEMVQLWVNLPADSKMTHPRYQGLVDKRFVRVPLGAATARLVAGTLGSAQGVAKTHSPVTLFDLSFDRSGEAMFVVPEHHTLLMVALRGEPALANGVTLPERHVAVFDRKHQASSAEAAPVLVKGSEGDKVLVLSGQPLGEPVVAHGPFVMNTREQISQAIRDYQAGKMGTLRPTEAKAS